MALEKIQRLSVQPLGSGVSRGIIERLKRVNRLFLVTVVVPTIAATVYYGLIASDVYVSESKFVVRSPQKEAQTGLFSSLLAGTGFSRSQDDAYAVNEYLMSRDAAAALDRDHYLEKAYSAKDVDFISRFPAFDFDRSFEALYRYYKKQVNIQFDSTSSIISLQVDAFTANEAQHVNNMLLQLSEQLINKMNKRASEDLVTSAQNDVLAAESKVKQAALALSRYRADQNIFDTDKQSELELQQAAGIQQSLIDAKTQLAQLNVISPNNPQVPALKARIASLQGEFGRATRGVTGDQGSLVQKDPDYQRLQLDRQFAEARLASAMTSLQTARANAQRQQLYLEQIAAPSLPDKAIEPRRIRGIITIFALGLVAWGALSLLIASIREHRT